jgi:hypothetical protein
VSARDRVFVDANELFPFSTMDLVLALAEDLLIDFVWTDELLDEWERVIANEGKRTPETARSVSEANSPAATSRCCSRGRSNRASSAASGLARPAPLHAHAPYVSRPGNTTNAAIAEPAPRTPLLDQNLTTHFCQQRR